MVAKALRRNSLTVSDPKKISSRVGTCSTTTPMKPFEYAKLMVGRLFKDTKCTCVRLSNGGAYLMFEDDSALRIDGKGVGLIELSFSYKGTRKGAGTPTITDIYCFAFGQTGITGNQSPLVQGQDLEKLYNHPLDVEVLATLQKPVSLKDMDVRDTGNTIGRYLRFASASVLVGFEVRVPCPPDGLTLTTVKARDNLTSKVPPPLKA